MPVPTIANAVSGVVVEAEAERDHDRDHERGQDAVDRGAVLGVDVREERREGPDPSHGVGGPAGHVHPGVGIRDGRVDDRQEDEEPEDAVERAGDADPRGAGGSRGEAGEPLRAESDVHGVGGEHVQGADQHRGQQHRALDRPARVPGLLGQRRGPLEAAEGQDREDRPGDHPGDAVESRRGVFGGEDRRVLWLPACTTRKMASTRKTPISNVPRMVPSLAEVLMP